MTAIDWRQKSFAGLTTTLDLDYSRASRWPDTLALWLVLVVMFYSAANIWPWLTLHNIFSFFVRVAEWNCGRRPFVRDVHCGWLWLNTRQFSRRQTYIDLRVIYFFACLFHSSLLPSSISLKCFRSERKCLLDMVANKLTKIQFYGWTNKIRNITFRLWVSG